MKLHDCSRNVDRPLPGQKRPMISTETIPSAMDYHLIAPDTIGNYISKIECVFVVCQPLSGTRRDSTLSRNFIRFLLCI